MDSLTPQLRAALSAFVAAVEDEIPVVSVYIFGSVARGDAEEDSDVDVAIVSPAFRGMRRVDAIAFLLTKAKGLGIDLQPIPMTPEEISDSTAPVARAVATEGIEFVAA